VVIQQFGRRLWFADYYYVRWVDKDFHTIKEECKMRICLLVFGVVATSSVLAQTSYQQIGNTTYGSNGTSYQQIGNTTYGSNGTSYQQIGNTTYGSNGKSCTKVGSTTFCN
jgi:hypothetical protein